MWLFFIYHNWFLDGSKSFQRSLSWLVYTRAYCPQQRMYNIFIISIRYLFVYLHVCICGRLCACLSCKTSLASLCRGHANWTVKKREDRFMFLCSPLTGAVLLLCLLVGLGARAYHKGHIHRSAVLWAGSRCLSSLGQNASESENIQMSESKADTRPCAWS